MASVSEMSKNARELLSRIERPPEEQNVGSAERAVSAVLGTAFVALGLGRRSLGGLLLAGAGSVLLHRGLTGRCAMYDALGVEPADATPGSHPFAREIRGESTITIARPVEEVFGWWRDLTHLADVMPNVMSIETRSHHESHWVGVGPRGRSLEWDARIVDERPGEFLRWEALPGSDFLHAGEVRFREAPGGRGTEVRLAYRYRPPFGVLGAVVAKAAQAAPEAQIGQGLRRMKQLLETGEIATAESSAGPRSRKGRTALRLMRSAASGAAPA